MKRRFRLTLLVLLSLSVGWGAGVAGVGTAIAQPVYDHLTLFAEVLGHVQNRYVDDVEDRVLIEAAIEGMLSELDPHSIYMNPEEYEALKNDTRGEYVGVGIVIRQLEGGGVAVQEVFPGGPADLAGIAVDDVFVAIDGQAMDSAVSGDVVGLLRGRRGESVDVIVRRGDEAVTLEIVRDMIHVDAVVETMPMPGFGVVRVRQFQTNVSDEIREAIDRLQSDNGAELSGLVLDLRGNPGGLLSEAIAVSDVFLSEGRIVSTGGRASPENEWEARRGSTRYSGPLVVLMDAGSASASEIVAGALQDLERAEIIGMQSYGKGSVQTIIDLTDGSGLKLTISRYYTPSGRSISGSGITPDTVIQAGEVPSELRATGPTAMVDVADQQLRTALSRLVEIDSLADAAE